MVNSSGRCCAAPIVTAGHSGCCALNVGRDPTSLGTGGVFKTINQGTTWSAVFEKQAVASVGAVAVCYLHSYRDPRHERETRRLLARLLPDAYVSLSSDVLAQIKEYERFCTTAVNAYVGPVLARYLGSLGSRLQKAGYRGDVLIRLPIA